MKDLPALLTVSLLAPLLGLSEHGTRALIRRGELPASRLGKRWVVRRDALEAHLKRQERRLVRRPREDAVGRLLRALPARRRRKSG